MNNANGLGKGNRAGWRPVAGGGDWWKNLGSVLKCPHCKHSACDGCKEALTGQRKGAYFRQRACHHPRGCANRLIKSRPLVKNFLRCCACGKSTFLFGWYYGRSKDRLSYDHRAEKRSTISKNEYDGERLALESEVQRGITTQAEARKWIGAMIPIAGDRYIHQDEILRRLACEGEKGKK